MANGSILMHKLMGLPGPCKVRLSFGENLFVPNIFTFNDFGIFIDLETRPIL